MYGSNIYLCDTLASQLMREFVIMDGYMHLSTDTEARISSKKICMKFPAFVSKPLD